MEEINVIPISKVLKRPEVKLFDEIQNSLQNVTRMTFQISRVYGNIVISKYHEIFPWDHVSMHVEKPELRCPTYTEMVWLKDLCWKSCEVAFQVHPADKNYVNMFEYALHLWRDNSMSKEDEKQLIQKIKALYKRAKELRHNQSVFEFESDEFGKAVAIFGENRWPLWDEVCEIKQKYWNPDEAAIQFNLGGIFDRNSEYLMVLVDAKKFKLPEKVLV